MTTQTFPSSPPACTGGEPPQCCQPLVIPPAFLSTRAFWASLAPGDVPTRCPACSGSAVTPLFWPDTSLDQFECHEPDCRAIFCWRD